MAILVSLGVFIVVGVRMATMNDPMSGAYKSEICRRQFKTQCQSGNCERKTELLCHHGECSIDSGECVCKPCWTGDSCHIPLNSHLPIFRQTTLTINLDPRSLPADGVIATVRADDPDAHNDCSQSMVDDCRCGVILYSINSEDESSPLFTIDPRSGMILITEEGLLQSQGEALHELKISAINQFHESMSATMAVRIILSSGKGAVHSRGRRSVDGIPTEANFTLEKLPPYANLTDILVGEAVSLRLTVWLPILSTSMKVELLAPYAVMTLCKPTFSHVGSNYAGFDRESVVPEYHAHGGDARYNRILLDLGSLTNTGSNTINVTSGQIWLDYTVILQQSNDTHYGDNYTVSTQVMYGDNLTDVWVGRMPFTPADDSTNWTTTPPSLNISGPANMSVLMSAVFNIDLVLTNIVTDFYIDVLTDGRHPGESTMEIRDFRFSGKGDNYACLPNELPKLSSFQDIATNTPVTRLHFGKIVNTGLRSGKTTIAANTLTTEAVVYLTNSSSIINGGTAMLNVRVTVNGINVYSDQLAFTTLRTTQPNMMVSADTLIPTFKLSNRGRDYFFYQYSIVSFNITVNIPPETTHAPLLLNITAQSGPTNKQPLFAICRVEVVHVGESFDDYNNTQAMLTSVTSTEGVVHQYVVDLGVVSNSREASMQTNADEGAIVVEVHLQWVDNSELIDGENVMVTVAVSYGSNSSWADSLGYTVNYSGPDSLTGDNSSQFNLSTMVGQNSTLRAGGAGVYHLTVQTPPNSVAAYWVEVVTPNDTLSVCRIQLVSSGRNLACFDIHRPVWYYSDMDHRKAVLDIGAVRNSAPRTTSDDSDNNTMVVQIVVSLQDSAIPTNNLTSPERQSFEVNVKVGATDLFTVSQDVGVDVEPKHSIAVPSMRFTKSNNESMVTIGGAVVYNLDIFVPYGSIANYKVYIYGDRHVPNRTTICSARLIQSGWNIPCVNGTLLTTEYSSTTGDGRVDAALVNLGRVTNMMAGGPPLESDGNKVRVQVVFRLEDSKVSSIEARTQVDLLARLVVDETDNYTLVKSFTATQDSVFSETSGQPVFAVTPLSGILTVGSKATYHLKITMPVMSTTMMVAVTMPTANDEAIMTIVGTQLVRVGENYACPLERTPVYNSTFSTSQIDKAFMDLGVIANHGMSHYYQYNQGNALPEDDEILMSLDVQLADHADLYDGAQVTFDISFKYSLDRQSTYSPTVNVSIVGDEHPELNCTVALLEYNPAVTQQGDHVAAYLSIYHASHSTSNACNVRLTIMPPHYVEINPEVELEGATLTMTILPIGVQFHFSKMFLSDVVTLRLNVSLDPNRYFPMMLDDISTTLPVEVVYYTCDGTDSNGSVILADVYKTETLIAVSFKTDQCFQELGIPDSLVIHDCQITASSYLNESYPPQQARLNSDSGWAPAIRDMKPYRGNEYLQVKFGGTYRFSAIRLQKGFNSSLYVTSFKLSYSVDGVVWFDYNQTFVANYSDNSTSLSMIPVPFNGKALRIRPQSYASNSTFPVLRFELYGCQLSVHIDLQIACPATDYSVYHYYERGYLLEPENGVVFVCILEYIDGPTVCSYSEDNGTTWNAVDNNIANVLAVAPNTKEIFGLSQNKRAIMRSDNIGVTWSSMVPERYLDLLNDGSLLEAVEVPFEEIADVPNVTVATQGDSIHYFEWGAARRGLYRREVMNNHSAEANNWKLMGIWA